MPDLPSLMPSAPLESRRVRLRPMTMADVPDVAAIRTLPEVHAYLSHGALSQEKLDARMRLRVERMTMRSDQKSSVHFVIESRDDGATIGDCGLQITPMWTKDEAPIEHVEAVINYVLAPQVGGRGLGTEVVALLTDHAFGEPRVHCVRADVFALNTASRTVLRRNNFRQEALFVENGVIDGEFVDSCVYALLRREWATHREGG